MTVALSWSMTGIALLTLTIATAAVENPPLAAAEPTPADQKTVQVSAWDPDDHSMAGAIAGGVIATAVAVAIPITLSATVGLPSWGASSLLGNGGPATEGQKLGTGLLLGGLATLVPLSTWGGHRLGGGKGSFVSAMIGGALGALATTAIALLAQPNPSASFRDGIGSGVSAAFIVALAVGLPATASVIAIQYEHSKWVPRLNVTPANGGATLSMNWSL